MAPSWSRRDILRLSGAGIALLTGCASDQQASNRSSTSSPPSETTSTTRPPTSLTSTQTPEPTDSPTPEEVPVTTPPACDGSLTRLDRPSESVSYGQVNGFELTASADTVARGEDIGFTLMWVESTGEDPTTGNDEMFTIDQKAENGWQSIYRIRDPPNAGWTSLAHPAPSNESPPVSWFEWSFTATQDGLAHSTQFNVPYAVCEPLTTGTYRFVYWGLDEAAVGYQFELTE